METKTPLAKENQDSKENEQPIGEQKEKDEPSQVSERAGSSEEKSEMIETNPKDPE